MELQSGAIVIIIILLSFVLISYAIYLIYNENKLLKGKLNELYNNMNNLETNIKNIFTQDTEDHDHENEEHEENESEEDKDHDSEINSDSDEEVTFETYGTTTSKPSFEMFGNSSEELEYLKQIQNTIQQGNKIEEIEETEETEETGEQEEVSPEIKINIPSKNKKCTKILTHGKRKDQECNRPVSDQNDVCKLHLSN